MIVAPFIRNVIAPLWAWHERSPYLRVCRGLRQREHESTDERAARQWAMVVKLVDHAYRNCPFYRKRFEAEGFRPGDLKNPKDFERLPRLTKSDIVEHSAEMISGSADRSRLVPRKTSGSTGASLHFFVDDAEYQFKRGVVLYRDQWTGWRLGEWRAAVWGNPTASICNIDETNHA
jgi:phenylacetate-CoA ligase